MDMIFKLIEFGFQFCNTIRVKNVIQEKEVREMDSLKCCIHNSKNINIDINNPLNFLLNVTFKITRTSVLSF